MKMTLALALPTLLLAAVAADSTSSPKFQHPRRHPPRDDPQPHIQWSDAG